MAIFGSIACGWSGSINVAVAGAASNSATRGAGVLYRQLQSKDFQAKVPPQIKKSSEFNIDARCLVVLQTSGGTSYRIVPVIDGGFIGEIGNLRFAAFIIPEGSWLNPNIQKSEEAYVLQHEQIHYALMEIAARQLNKRVHSDPVLKNLHGKHQEDVQKMMAKRVRELLWEVESDVQKRHQVFDADTSGTHNASRQAEWYGIVADELQALKEWRADAGQQ